MQCFKDLSEAALKRPKTRQDEEKMLSELEGTKWTSENSLTIGQLWHRLLIFYGVEFNLAEHIICVRNHKLVSRSEKKWKSKRVALEGKLSLLPDA